MLRPKIATGEGVGRSLKIFNDPFSTGYVFALQ
jgi:hypothetical protein